MARYNPSLESDNLVPEKQGTEIDANTNNPVLEVEQPKSEDKPEDFEYSETPELDKGAAKESDYVFTGSDENTKEAEAFIGEQKKEGDNIVKEIGETNNVLETLDSVATEMYNIIRKEGRISSLEAVTLGMHLAAVDRVSGYKAKEAPALENFQTPALAYSATQASFEGIGDRIEAGLERLGENIVRLMKNGVGFAGSLTVLIDRNLARIAKLRTSINAAHRDAGQKEVKGGFIKRLQVDGNTPDANTVEKTATYLAQCMTEILSNSQTKAAAQYVRAANDTLIKAASDGMDNVDHTNPLWLLIFSPEFLVSLNYNKVANTFKIDGSVAPQLFKVYPSAAKVNHSFGDMRADKNLEIRRSLPLFGNRAIAVSQYRSTVEVGCGRHSIPKLTLVDFGEGRGDSRAQALTGQQQKQALDSAEKILLVARDYFKNYATRNKECMDTYMRYFKQLQKWRNNNTGRGQGEKTISVAAGIQIMRYYSNLYWTGIFAQQSDIASYGRKTAAALIDLVEASSIGAQGSKPSTESFDLQDNPFL